MTLVTKSEAAEFLGVSVRTLERMCLRGVLPAYRIGPKAVRLSMEDIEDYVRGHLVAPQPVRKQAPARPCRYVPGMKVV